MNKKNIILHWVQLALFVIMALLYLDKIVFYDPTIDSNVSHVFDWIALILPLLGVGCCVAMLIKDYKSK
jgi:hypothetical protein